MNKSHCNHSERDFIILELKWMAIHLKEKECRKYSEELRICLGFQVKRTVTAMTVFLLT